MKHIALFLLFTGLLFSCKTKTKTSDQDNKENRIVMVSTDYGDMKIRLYDETPNHRNNFIKLANAKFFDGTLFHRVISDFMIQGGDPDSKDAKKGARLGEGGPGYQIDAEFNAALFHKRGVIAAAREGDAVNPEKKSAGSQFYIAQGKVYRSGELDTLVMKINDRRRNSIFGKIQSQYKNQLIKLQQSGEMVKVAETVEKINSKVDSLMQIEKLVLSSAQKEAYTTIGGIPHLDGNYTVFGEVIEGMQIIDSISVSKTDQFDRPLEDIKMTIKVLQ